MDKTTEYHIAVVGLGYVGLIVALNFSEKYPTIGFDTNPTRIKELKNYFDRNLEISKQTLKSAKIQFGSNEKILKNANFYIIAVPTPLTPNKRPDLTFLKRASRTVAKYLKKDDVVVYESTVYPGVTEDILIPILEKTSELKSDLDFHVGYSPERINPGDQKNSFTNTTKIVSGHNEAALKIVTHVYQSVIEADLYPAKSIKVAEAAKLVENAQRDVNISFVNELALIFDHLNIDTHEVLNAAKTKWNFLHFEPGLVGGHCVSVSSRYLAYKSMLSGYCPQLVTIGRKINESVYLFSIKKVQQGLEHFGKTIKNSRIGILGLAYKENTAFITDSLVADMAQSFISLGAEVLLHDPLVDKAMAKKDFGLELEPLDKLRNLDGLVVAVAHQAFKKIPQKNIINMLNSQAVIADLKSILNPTKFKQDNIILWRL